MSAKITDLGSGKPAAVEQKLMHVGIAELLTHASESIMQARALSQKLPLHPNPGVIMGQILAANLAATESLVQAVGAAYNMFGVAFTQKMTMTKIGGPPDGE